MEDKTFELIEKMYVNFSRRFDNLEKEVQKNSNHIIRLEGEFHNKMGALSDDIQIIKHDIEDIKNKVEKIEVKVEKHDIKIQVIEGGKKKKSV